ncbi:MAG: putative membrane protein, partial [uncultured Gemmatimonadaceae bacterium]
DLPRPRRRGARRPPRLRALRGARRARRAPLAARGVGARPRGAVRGGDRVHRVRLPAHAARGGAAATRRGGGVRRRLHRPLRHRRDLPGGAHARDPARAGRGGAAGERGGLRRVAAATARGPARGL